MDCLEKIESLAGLELNTFPAASDILFLAAPTHFAIGRTTTCSASFLTTKFDHGAQNLVALRIVFENLKERMGRYCFCEFLEFHLSQLLPQVSGQVCDGARMAKTVATL